MSSPLAGLFAGARAVTTIGARFSGVITDVIEAMANDGNMTTDEAGNVGREAAMASGNWRVKVRGNDVLDDETQALIGEAAGRTGARIFSALSKPKTV